MLGFGNGRKKRRQKRRPGPPQHPARPEQVHNQRGIPADWAEPTDAGAQGDRLSPDDLDTIAAQSHYRDDPYADDAAGQVAPTPAILRRDLGEAGPADGADGRSAEPRGSRGRKSKPKKKKNKNNPGMAGLVVDGYVSWANMLGGGKKKTKRTKARRPAPPPAYSEPPVETEPQQWETDDPYQDRVAAFAPPQDHHRADEQYGNGHAHPDAQGGQNGPDPQWDGRNDSDAWERDLSLEREQSLEPPTAAAPKGDFAALLKTLRGEGEAAQTPQPAPEPMHRQPQAPQPAPQADPFAERRPPAITKTSVPESAEETVTWTPDPAPEPAPQPVARVSEPRPAEPPAQAPAPQAPPPRPRTPEVRAARADAPGLDAFETAEDDPGKQDVFDTRGEAETGPVYEQWREPAPADVPMDEPREAVPFERPNDPLPRIVQGERGDMALDDEPAPAPRPKKRSKPSRAKKGSPRKQAPRRRKGKSDLEKLIEAVCAPIVALPGLFKSAAASPADVGDYDFRKPIMRGLIVAGFTFIGFGGWAMTAELSSAVIAMGELKVFGSRKPVQHLEGGIIEEILVRDGDRVRVGSVLVRLSSTRAEARYSINQGRYDAARAEVARLKAEKNGLEQIEFPQDMLARASRPEIAQIMQTEITNFNARLNTVRGKTSLIDKRINQLQEEIRGLEAQTRANTQQITLLRDELSGARDLFKEGYAPKTRVLELEREIANLEGRRGEYVASMARARQSISEAELQINQTATEFREQVVRQIQEKERAVFDLANELGATSDTLKRTEIKAPANGVVVGMAIHGRDTVIQPGQVLMEIVPDSDSLVVEAQVQPKDRHKVLKGLVADVQLSALSQRSSTKMTGTVIYVSADRMSDERTGQPYYVAQVEISESEVKNLKDVELKPGMPADIFIKTGSRTPFDYLTSPLTESLGRAWRES